MKTILSIILACLVVNSANAQNFITGHTDVSGDITQSLSPDLKTIFHATDHSTDSIWFKLEFYQRVDNISWNIKIGIDTNNNGTDGGIWAGLNQSMKYDLLADVYNNPGFPPAFGNILDGSGNYVSSNVSVYVMDTNVVVVNMKLSEIQQPGVELHYVAGAGIVVGLVNDDIPDTGSVLIALSTGITDLKFMTDISLYPNPVNDILHISAVTGSILTACRFEISDLHGIIKSGIVDQDNFSVDTGSLSNGVYFIRISGNNLSVVFGFIKTD